MVRSCFHNPPVFLLRVVALHLSKHGRYPGGQVCPPRRRHDVRSQSHADPPVLRGWHEAPGGPWTVHDGTRGRVCACAAAERDALDFIDARHEVMVGDSPTGSPFVLALLPLLETAFTRVLTRGARLSQRGARRSPRTMRQLRFLRQTIPWGSWPACLWTATCKSHSASCSFHQSVVKTWSLSSSTRT